MKKRSKRSSVEVPQVSVHPTGCPSCGCSDRTNKQAMRRRQMNGQTLDGFVYTEVVWSYVNCKECGQKYRIIEYLRPVARTCDTRKHD